MWHYIDIGPYTVAEITGLEKQSYAIRVQAKSLDGRYGNASASVMANTPSSKLNLIDWFIVFNATFSNISAISWRPVLVEEEAGENHRPWASNW